MFPSIISSLEISRHQCGVLHNKNNLISSNLSYQNSLSWFSPAYQLQQNLFLLQFPIDSPSSLFIFFFFSKCIFNFAFSFSISFFFIFLHCVFDLQCCLFLRSFILNLLLPCTNQTLTIQNKLKSFSFFLSTNGFQNIYIFFNPKPPIQSIATNDQTGLRLWVQLRMV